MAPPSSIWDDSAMHVYRRDNDTNSTNTFGNWRDVDNTEAYIIEGWGEGFMFGALLIMAIITVANMRRRVLLHKMILLELLFAMSHGTFCFMAFNGYGFYLSSTAALLYCSYFTHNVVAWMKIQPFFSGPQPLFGPKLSEWVRWIFLITLAMTAPVIIFEIFNNFRFFNNYSTLYETVRPYEPLMRDPWWVFSCLTFFHAIRRGYSLNVFKLIGRSPRFGIMLVAIFLAIAFTIMDILASLVSALRTTDGINPYWKLALVFKCLTDNIILDDFKSVLQRLGAMRISGATTILPGTINMTPNGKGGPVGDEELYEAEFSSQLKNDRFLSISGRMLDDHEVANGSGYGYKAEPEVNNAVGKLGIKIRKLPSLLPLPFSSKTENHRRTLASDKTPAASDSGRSKSAEQPPMEHVDFITVLTDPAIEDRAPGKDSE